MNSAIAILETLNEKMVLEEAFQSHPVSTKTSCK